MVSYKINDGRSVRGVESTQIAEAATRAGYRVTSVINGGGIR